jgi:hypothetical protein
MRSISAGSVTFVALPTSVGPVLLPTLIVSGLPRAMRFAFQLSGPVVKKIRSPSYRYQIGTDSESAPLFRVVAV